MKKQHCAPSSVEERSVLSTNTPVFKKKARIWIDLDNTPHVPLFKPIISELERRGHEVVLTARDAFQVCELANRHGLQYEKIGRHYGKYMLAKLGGLVWRSLQLLPFVARERPCLALSHGSRSQLLLANFLKIPTVLMYDYEHAKSPPFCRPQWRIAPESIVESGPANIKQVLSYSGIKEDVYAPQFIPDPTILSDLGVPEDALLVTVRPPADEAHYRNPESDVLFEALMERLCRSTGVRTVLLPRNIRQENAIRTRAPHWFANGKTVVPNATVDGLNLLWFSDLVVSGGGTMNREAAALGVPVYSIFRGKTGAVDRRLEAEGRLVMLKSVEHIESLIALRPRNKKWAAANRNSAALEQIAGHIENILCTESRKLAVGFRGSQGDVQ